MYRTLLTLVVSAGAAMVFAAAGTPTTVASAATAAPLVKTAESYWKCPSGYTFQVSGSAVHCKKPSWTETKPFMACGFPTATLKLDLVGQTDMCAGSVGTTVTVEPQCYPTDVMNGYTKRRVSGRDFCGKSHAAEVIAPNQLVVF
jgi:hypothetical protein